MKKRRLWLEKWRRLLTLTPPSCSSKEKVPAVLRSWQRKRPSGFKLKLCVASDFPANNIVKFLLGFTNKGSENFVVESLDASFRYPQVKKLLLLLLLEIFDLWPSGCVLPLRTTSSTSRTSLLFSWEPSCLLRDRPPSSTPSSPPSRWEGGRSGWWSTSTTRTAL